MSKKIKIPKGEITLVFEGKDNLHVGMTDKILIEIISDVLHKQEEKMITKVFDSQKQELKYENLYDDESPDYIKMSTKED